MGSCRVCPWWLGWLLANPLRKFWQNPTTILAPWLAPGMTVLEPGPGMGFFTLEAARLVGPGGRVVALDVQPKMVEGLRRRARRQGLDGRLDARVVPATTLAIADLAQRVDFALAFAVVHETPDAAAFLGEIAAALKPGGLLLLVEPAGHVRAEQFQHQCDAAADAGLALVDRPEVGKNHTALLQRRLLS